VWPSDHWASAFRRAGSRSRRLAGQTKHERLGTTRGHHRRLTWDLGVSGHWWLSGAGGGRGYRGSVSGRWRLSDASRQHGSSLSGKWRHGIGLRGSWRHGIGLRGSWRHGIGLRGSWRHGSGLGGSWRHGSGLSGSWRHGSGLSGK
jgi:hypothetical protein